MTLSMPSESFRAAKSSGSRTSVAPQPGRAGCDVVLGNGATGWKLASALNLALEQSITRRPVFDRRAGKAI